MRAGLGTVAAIVMLALAGCGGGNDDDSLAQKSGNDIARAASQDMTKLHSLRIAGHLTTGGQRAGLDVSVTTEGNCTGSITVRGGSADLLVVDGTVWLRPDAAFLDIGAPGQGTRLKQFIGDKWLVDQEGRQLADLCDLDNLLKAFRDTASGKDPRVSVVGKGHVGTQDAIRLQGTDHGDTFVAWVAKADPHYVLRMDFRGSDEPGTLTFSDFDKPVRARKPLPSEIVDLSGAQAG